MSSSAIDGDGFESQSFGSFSSNGESTSVKDGKDGGGFSPEGNRNGTILPPPEILQPEEGVALKEWRRQNAIRLEEKQKREKEILNEIIEEAEEHKAEFYRKWNVRVDNNKANNREKQKLLLESQEKFHAEASKNYWKAAAEMIPREVPIIEKKGKKKDQDKQPSIVVIHGPKPGKPTDLSRMRQVLLKLKHKPPPHMNTPALTPSSMSSSIPGEDGKAVASSSTSSAPQELQATTVTLDLHAVEALL